MTGRFAPSTTGLAHPGTLLAALLAWLDARSRGEALILRLDDADPQRCRPEWSQRMREDLAWFGLDWDGEQSQLQRRAAHDQTLAALAARGLLYACTCSRSSIREQGLVAPDGSWRYPGICRARRLAAQQWRELPEAVVRLRLPDQAVVLRDEGGGSLDGHPLQDFGDPVLRRRDGAIAYQLSVVLDDAAAGVDRVVRGRDLACHSATQALIHDLLDLPRPTYRHHLLLLEEQGAKHAKFHGSVDCGVLRGVYGAEELCGLLAACAGLGEGSPCRPVDLLGGFAWSRVAVADRLLRWTGSALELGPADEAGQTAHDG
jgi:glutamyl/glutaminyl-tRNA synthetase